MVDDCQRATRTSPRPGVIMITGTDDHDPPDSMITIKRIE